LLRHGSETSLRAEADLLAAEDVGVAHALEGGGPEPAPDIEGLEPRLVATINLPNKLHVNHYTDKREGNFGGMGCRTI